MFRKKVQYNVTTYIMNHWCLKKIGIEPFLTRLCPIPSAIFPIVRTCTFIQSCTCRPMLLTLPAKLKKNNLWNIENHPLVASIKICFSSFYEWMFSPRQTDVSLKPITQSLKPPSTNFTLSSQMLRESLCAVRYTPGLDFFKEKVNGFNNYLTKELLNSANMRRVTSKSWDVNSFIYKCIK
jgi:hypothetical protein